MPEKPDNSSSLSFKQKSVAMNTKPNAYERDCECEIRANPNLNPKHTTISRIIYSLTPPSSFEYDTWVSNYCLRKIEALCARCDEWLHAKEACFEQDDKEKYRSAVGSRLLQSV